MKKPRIILIAMAVLAIAGGTLAFNVKTSKTLYTGTNGVCTSLVSFITTVPAGTAGAVQIYASSSSFASGCPQTYTLAAPNN